MTSRSSIALSANFYKLATACCAYYVGAQIIQEFTFLHGINNSATGEQAILQRLLPLDQFRLAVMLASFFAILVAFGAVALRRIQVSPGASILGFTFAFLFVASEVSARSIDLFLISRKWAAAYQFAASPAVRQQIAGSIHVWEESVGSFYFVLLAGHLLASVCFAVATWDGDRWDRTVAVAFVANALRLTGRLAEGYLGQAWLGPVNGIVYFPAVATIFTTLAAWLWRQTRSVHQDSEGVAENRI